VVVMRLYLLSFDRAGLHYTSPATAANSALSTDMTTAIANGVPQVLPFFGATGPEVQKLHQPHRILHI